MRQVAPIRKRLKAKPVVNVKYRLYEGLFIFFIAIAIYLFISLVSYHQSDPGWSGTGVSGEVANAGGKLGAWFADLFLYFFGYLAYLFPMMCLVPAWMALRQSIVKQEINRFQVLLHFLGFVFTISAGCGLADLYLHNLHAHIPLNAGGGQEINTGEAGISEWFEFDRCQYYFDHDNISWYHVIYGAVVVSDSPVY